MEYKEETENARKLYNSSENIWPKNDPWHENTRRFITQTVEKILSDKCRSDMKILNAGSGGTIYNLRGEFYDCDIAEYKISHSANPIVASIEDLPCLDNFFDISICVGSVLNYCDATVVINELFRTLKPQGWLILEFERSDSAEFLFTKQHHRSAFQKDYLYNGQTHRLWLYSEKYIVNTLRMQKLRIVKIFRFHTLSSLIFRITQNEYISAMYMAQDWIVSLFSYHLAHNSIMVCQKRG
jgi:SAM-dependent methyltransferase